MLAAALALASAGCAVPRQMLASPGDLADYRAFKVAADEGRRLFEAQRYLERHPDGAWAEEVRALFDAEEAAFFEAAKLSRVRAREYVVDLPHGPHADAARSLMVLFDEHQEDADTLILLAQARRTGAMLDYETNRRRRASETVLAQVAALLDPAVYGARLDAPPPALSAALRGGVALTWGGGSHARRHEDLFFVVPTPDGAHAAAIDDNLQVWVEGGVIARGEVSGEDLFVRWAESLLVHVLDPGAPADRHAAAVAVIDVLGGALEATLPEARCRAGLAEGGLLARRCDGWEVTVRMGAAPGTEDSVEVRGPSARADAPGMR